MLHSQHAKAGASITQTSEIKFVKMLLQDCQNALARKPHLSSGSNS
jgi:hypothetical protein